MATNLKNLLKILPNATVFGSKDRTILGLSEHVQTIGPGYIYFARRGEKYDGNQFVPQAISNGAIVIVTDMYDPSLPVTQIIVPDVIEAENILAKSFYSNPSEALFLVGITGTSGKTTVSFLVRQLFEKIGYPCGLIGTISYITGLKEKEASKTTPDSITNQMLLADMVRASMSCCSMEVSSHALVQKRVEGLLFQAAVFTNLSHEHLDYHKTMEEYVRAKNVLFKNLPKESFAIVNCDDEAANKVLEGCVAKRMTFGMSRNADLRAEQVVLGKTTSCTLLYKGQAVSCSFPLIGRFNVYNMLAAVSVLLAKGICLEEIARAAAFVFSPPGRLEIVPNSLGISVCVDYAHKEDALRKVLPILREMTKGKIITVFGCGGDRDRLKRPLMAKAVEEFSDITIVTSDNPRSEDPMAIIAEIVAGFAKNEHHIEPDREAAIHMAIRYACPGDCVLIAGKGHEKEQIIAGGRIPFDDVAVAAQGCDQKAKTLYG